jgi:hypothetical protein
MTTELFIHYQDDWYYLNEQTSTPARVMYIDKLKFRSDCIFTVHNGFKRMLKERNNYDGGITSAVPLTAEDEKELTFLRLTAKTL